MLSLPECSFLEVHTLLCLDPDALTGFLETVIVAYRTTKYWFSVPEFSRLPSAFSAAVGTGSMLSADQYLVLLGYEKSTK